jgi:hypothetical protein
MKNKKLTYLLGLLAVIVWGMIIDRIFNALTAEKEVGVMVVQNLKRHEDLNDYSVPTDTTHLLLNYKDPFRLTKQPDTTTKVARQTARIREIPSAPKPIFSWNFIKYSGYTRTAGSKKLLAVMTINGQSAIMQEGEMASEVKLIKNYQDSVKVTFKGRTGYIRMQ